MAKKGVGSKYKVNIDRERVKTELKKIQEYEKWQKSSMSVSADSLKRKMTI